MNRPLVVLGGGGHAAVVVAAARAAGRDVFAVYDDDESLLGTDVIGARVVGAISDADAVDEADAVIAIGSNESRRAPLRGE